MTEPKPRWLTPEVEAKIKKLVDEAPPLTSEQIWKLRTLLRTESPEKPAQSEKTGYPRHHTISNRRSITP